MNIKNLSKTLILSAVALLWVCPVNAQDAGASDRTDGSFDVPGWFPKSQSDIARYPVPLTQTPQSNPADTAPLVVLQKFGPPGAPLTKSILVPTPFGYQQKSLNSVPWGGAASGGYSASSYYGGSPSFYGGSSYIPSISGYQGGYLPNIGGFAGYGSGFGGFGMGSIPGISHIPGLGGFGGLGSIGRIGGMGYGGYAAPYMGGSGFGFGGPGYGMIGQPSRTIIVQPSENKNQGNNYYTAPAAGGSGYYSSGTPAVQPTAVTIPPRQSPKEYWGESGNPFGSQDLNKTPW